MCLILGDNILYGSGLYQLFENAKRNSKNNQATVFGYYVQEPDRYGVVEFNKRKVLSIEEKPKTPKSNYAIIGLYFYPNDVVQKAKKIKPSDRGELEITSVNQQYLEENRLQVEIMGRGYAWLDTGTHEALAEASTFIETIEKRQGLKIGCIEEIAWRKGFISSQQLSNLGENISKNQYGKYILKLLEK